MPSLTVAAMELGDLLTTSGAEVRSSVCSTTIVGNSIVHILWTTTNIRSDVTYHETCLATYRRKGGGLLTQVETQLIFWDPLLMGDQNREVSMFNSAIINSVHFTAKSI